MDILGNRFDILEFRHLEWWNGILQYSSNTTQLYWVFNQSIMIWLITAVIINCKKRSSIVFASCLSFCYSPFATFGMIPIAIALVIKRNNNNDDSKIIKLKKLVKDIIPEIFFSMLILIIYGSFYLSANSSISVNGLTYKVTGLELWEFLILYMVFIVTEFLFYFLMIRKQYKKDILFIVISIELFLIPIYLATPANDFCMRVSISPLFILMIYVIDYLLNSNCKEKIFVLYIVLILGAVTPFNEIGRSVYNTFFTEDYLANKKINSIMDPITDSGEELCNDQFYCKDIDEHFFFKFLAKK
jgi:hypothetical protein